MNDLPNRDKQRLLDWKSGGWVLALAAVICVAYFGVFMYNALTSREGKPLGGGSSLSDYPFDLSALILPKEKLSPSGVFVNGIPAMSNPGAITPEEVKTLNQEERGKYLVPKDRVIGVSINGESRAYPLRVLNWHEVINDTLGGVPIAVTYNPLSGSVVVFERRIDESTLEFAHSGLLYNSHHLLFDRQEAIKQSSLWCPLLRKAISGPLAGTKLPTLPCVLTHWQHWVNHNPPTTVVTPLEAYKKRYKRNPYGAYFDSPVIRFPIDPLPDRPDRSSKSPMVIVDTGEQTAAYPFEQIAQNAGNNQTWTTQVNGQPVTFVYRPYPPVVEATFSNNPPDAAVYYSFWFAWYTINEAG